MECGSLLSLLPLLLLVNPRPRQLAAARVQSRRSSSGTGQCLFSTIAFWPPNSMSPASQLASTKAAASSVLCLISSLTYFTLVVTGILAYRGLALLMVLIGLAATYRQECLYLPTCGPAIRCRTYEPEYSVIEARLSKIPSFDGSAWERSLLGTARR